MDIEKIQLLEEPTISKENLKTIKKNLPLNYAELIAKKLNNVVSSGTVTHVLNGTRPDHNGIIEVALNIAVEEYEKKKSILKRIKKIK